MYVGKHQNKVLPNDKVNRLKRRCCRIFFLLSLYTFLLKLNLDLLYKCSYFFDGSESNTGQEFNLPYRLNLNLSFSCLQQYIRKTSCGLPTHGVLFSMIGFFTIVRVDNIYLTRMNLRKIVQVIRPV